MPFIEFSHNRSVHSSTEYSPFEVVYCFNPLTPLDFIPLPIDERVSLDGKRKTKMVKQLHECFRQQIEKKNKQNPSKDNKGRRHVIF